MSSQINTMIHAAVQNFQSGNLTGAEAILTKALQLEPKDFGALHMIGVVCAFQNRTAEAIDFFRRAVEVNPNSRLANYNLAKVLSESGDDRGALPHHMKAVELGPGDQDAWVNYGKSLFNLNRYDEALDCFEKALDINPDFAEALSNQGALFARTGRNEEALSRFDKALALNPSLPAAWSNTAQILCKLKRYDEALGRYDQAIRLNPDHAETWSDKGDALSYLRRYDEALAQYDHAIRLKPDYVEAWCKKGNVLNEMKRHGEALAHYDRAIGLKPDHDFLQGNRLSTKMSICDWDGVDELIAELSEKINSGQKVAAPFEVLCNTDSLSLHKKTAELYAQGFPEDHSLGTIGRRPKREKIRIGYFSRDFHKHATAFLTAELFELHDREKFEITAFSFGPDQNDGMRKRLVAAFDRFIDVRGRSDREIAMLSRELEIDVAVDLQGYQTEHRPGIFAFRAAPIQVNYLAYPGTVGSACIDYIVADDTLIPQASRQYYSEKIVYMPDSYQANDRQRVISGRQFEREALGLPQDAFVFCCFNGIHKITPWVFDSWMKILRQVPGSVLWLLEGHREAMENLRKEALNRGISPDRLIFAGFMELPDHLARHRLADLFLDTLPYNAHTTASDALWAGLPVLTCLGESFASRVAASLLNAVHLPELITRSQDEFVRTAVELARDTIRLEEMKRRLADNRLNAPLFDTPRYVRNLEAAYTAMYERHQADLQPDHIHVAKAE